MIRINLETQDWNLNSLNDMEHLVLPMGKRKICPCGDTHKTNEKCTHCPKESFNLLNPVDDDWKELSGKFFYLD
jgi:hypothetical protein